MYSWYRSTIWSPGLGVEFKTFCDKSVASPLAFILGRCLSTLPVEQEILPSDNYGTASLVEVVLCTWAGRRQLSTPTLTYLLTWIDPFQSFPKCFVVDMFSFPLPTKETIILGSECSYLRPAASSSADNFLYRSPTSAAGITLGV